MNNRDFDAFEEHNNSIWANKLVGEFCKQNNIVYSHLRTHLNEPNFAIDNSHSKWGTWNPETRTISISSNLLRNYHWDAVVHTLKHEMAHMVVDEIFRGEYSSHGEAFKKACDIMGIDDQKFHDSAFKATYALPEKEKIVNKIYKLFALGESNFEHESKIAIAKAYELMMKYNISEIKPSHEKVFICRPVGLNWRKIPSYIKKVARIVCNYYFVKHIYINGYRKKRLEFFGEPHNLDISEYVFHYLILEGERKWKEFQQTKEYRERSNRSELKWNGRRRAVYSKIAFLEGLYDGFRETLQTQNEIVISTIGENCQALIQQNDKILEDHFDNTYHPSTWYYGRSGGNADGYSKGRELGKGITIRSGVVRSSTGRCLQLSA